jgi:general secretion pathway protein D
VLRLFRLGFPAVAMTFAACAAVQDTAPMINSWGTGSLKAPVEQVEQKTPARASVLRNDGPSPRTTFIEGTGTFVGPQPNAAPAQTSTADGITLNLANVPVAQAAKTVLGDILLVQYTVHPSVDGKITIHTPNPVSKPEVMNLFESALRANNAAVMNAGGVYRIVPQDQALAGAKLKIGNGPSGLGGIGSGLRIVQLKYVSAAEMKLILEPISPRGGVVQADASRNTLTLSGSGQDIGGMLEAISIFDVDVMKGMSFAMVPVKTSQPGVIAEELQKIFATDHEGPMAGMVKFLPNKRLAAILIISPQRQYLSRAEGWIKRLDAQAIGSEKQFYTYKVQNRRAQELVEVLKSMFSTEGSSGNSGRNVTPQAAETSIRSNGSSFSRQQTRPRSAQGFGDGSTPDRGNGFGNGSGSADNGPTGSASAQIALAEGNGADAAPFRIVADDAKNAILIEASPAEYRRVLRVLETLDVMPNQVLIEATIAEVGLTNDLKFGLRWYFKDGGSNFSFTDSASGALNSVFPGFSYALKAANITATLNALNEITDVNIVSSPTLTVMDNKTATLQIGDQVPIKTQSAVSVINPEAAVINSISYKDTGVILAITPRINESGRVLLDIEQEVSSVAKTSSSGIDSPTISQRKVKTTVMVTDGESIALGGLIQTSKTKGRTQVPIVGDIPILGNVFKQKDDSEGKTELIILITPHVMRDVQEARQITEELKGQFAAQVWKHRDKSNAVENAARRTLD